MIKILFVCHGNICRSPMAEFVMKELVRERGLSNMFFIASAATSTEEIGNPIHRDTARVLDRENIPRTPRRAVQMKRADYDNYDYLIGMDSANIRNMTRIAGNRNDGRIIRLLDLTEEKRDVADPWYTGDFDKTYSDVVKGCSALLEYILNSSDIRQQPFAY